MRWLPDSGSYATFNESLSICEICDRDTYGPITTRLSCDVRNSG